MRIDYIEDIIYLECDNGYHTYYDEDYIMCVDMIRDNEIEKIESEERCSNGVFLLMRRTK